MDLAVNSVERTWVKVPFRPRPAHHMARELPHWNLFEICEVELACGVRGWGETTVYYTWGRVNDDAVQRVLGRPAPDLMWDDSLGAGLQMALFDAVGRANEVPCHRLMGGQHRQHAALSWWAIDMPGEDWLAECQEALANGYTSFKTKARPWFDLDRQVQTLSQDLPPWFSLDLDFNGLLLDTARASRLLTRIERYERVKIYESPIPQHDVAGNRSLRQKTRVPIAMHYGRPPIMTALQEDVCDGFVISGGVSRTLEHATVAQAAHKPFWLQHVGTGITATFALHQAAVLSGARWPAVNCHQLFTHQLIEPSITVEGGLAAVPEGPGLGVELDSEAVAAMRVEPQEKPAPAQGQLLAVRWPWKQTSYYSRADQYRLEFLNGCLPVFAEGVRLDVIKDDGSETWRRLKRKAAGGGIHMVEGEL